MFEFNLINSFKSKFLRSSKENVCLQLKAKRNQNPCTKVDLVMMLFAFNNNYSCFEKFVIPEQCTKTHPSAL